MHAFSKNNIEDKGAECIAEAISKLKQLTELKIYFK